MLGTFPEIHKIDPQLRLIAVMESVPELAFPIFELVNILTIIIDLSYSH